MAHPDFYRFGVEIEIITEPWKVRNPLNAEDYYERLARSLIKRNENAKADPLTGGYRKHDEHYKTRWWITRDGSLHSLTHPEIAFEAVSPIMATSDDWETRIDNFWKAEKAVFKMPKREQKCGLHVHVTPGGRQWSLVDLKNIALGIVVYENLILELLPSWRRSNAYSQRNTKVSNRMSSLSSNLSARKQAVSRSLAQISTKSELCDFMQSGARYVLWNFLNITKKSGTIEFRGGRGVRGPIRTKRWIAFVVAFIDFTLRESMLSRDREPSVSNAEALYRKVRGAAKDHGMRPDLPENYRVLNESARAEDGEGPGFEPHEIVNIRVVPKDSELSPYSTFPTESVYQRPQLEPVHQRSVPDFTYSSPWPAAESASEPSRSYNASRNDSSDSSGLTSYFFSYLRGAQFVCAAVLGGLAGGIIHQYGSGISMVIYCAFLAVWVVLVIIVHYAVVCAGGRSTGLVFTFDLLSLILWLAGAIALTIQLVVSDWASSGPGQLTTEARAICAFLWLGAVCFFITMALCTRLVMSRT